MVQDQPTPDPEGVPPRVEAVDDRRQWPIPVPCSLAVRRGCKGDLRIAHALRCLVLTELVRHPPEVLRVNETGPHGSVLNEEIAKARDDTAVARKTIWQRDGMTVANSRSVAGRTAFSRWTWMFAFGRVERSRIPVRIVSRPANGLCLAHCSNAPGPAPQATSRTDRRPSCRERRFARSWRHGSGRP